MTLTPADVDEIAARALQNVGRASVQYAPLKVLAALTTLDKLPQEDLDYRARLQFVLSHRVEDLLRETPQIIARLVQTTEAQVEEGRVPVGLIDWPSTWIHRLTAGGDPSSFVLRRSEIHRDLPENRLLKFMLGCVAEIADSLLDQPDSSGWAERVGTIRARSRQFVAHPILVPVQSLASRAGYLAARASRVKGYGSVAASYAAYSAIFDDGDPDALDALLREFVLIPEEEDRAFELLVLFRLAAHLEDAGANLEGIRLIGRGSGPVYTYLWGQRRLSITFQGAPTIYQKRSLYRKFVDQIGLGASLRRPDILLQLLEGDQLVRNIVIEAKCTADQNTARDGVFQLLGYNQDFGFALDAPTLLLVVGYGNIRPPLDYPSPSSLAHNLNGQGADLSSLGKAVDQWVASL